MRKFPISYTDLLILKPLNLLVHLNMLKTQFFPVILKFLPTYSFRVSFDKFFNIFGTFFNS